MSQILVRHLDPGVKQALQRRARQHGRSMEEEVRSILRASIVMDAPAALPLGQRMAARFAQVGLSAPIAEMRGFSPQAADLRDLG